MKYHVRRLRELLAAPSEAHVASQSPSLFAQITQQAERPTAQKSGKDKETNGTSDKELSTDVDLSEPNLSAFFPAQSPNKKAHKGTALPSCLKALSFSGWNPPPGYRKLRGTIHCTRCVSSNKVITSPLFFR
jgi:hypothetical protein